ncbi:RWD domain-containing protein 1-like [Mizuhopecten yessoensis]|uniref:RWD domain-containing protein 1 n=1 Tax=Mizuhopecten yessoensis TaxID=6573 RepID=A0A210QFU6_MIZYE|nr:RWD domain-containing protein 1-like [Mizuhopecten yessoensis]OWF47579.1 RWD domain-containing protein 1 [Mizuhopecten yessoensis]
MTDFKEEQNNEIEALESIYPDEISVISVQPYHVFEVHIESQDISDPYDTGVEPELAAQCTLQFSYVEKYPEDPPVFEITEHENLEDDQIEALNELITETIEESLGMVMVFTIVSTVQEKLTQFVEETKKNRIEIEEHEKKKKDELEMKKFEGTRVTIETFLAWKAKFDAEMSEQKRMKNQVVVGPKGLTGKELFFTDDSMNDSDVKFLQSEEDTVEVDESLFQDMDDLDLDVNDLDLEDTAVD